MSFFLLFVTFNIGKGFKVGPGHLPVDGNASVFFSILTAIYVGMEDSFEARSERSGVLCDYSGCDWASPAFFVVNM